MAEIEGQVKCSDEEEQAASMLVQAPSDSDTNQ